MRRLATADPTGLSGVLIIPQSFPVPRKGHGHHPGIGWASLQEGVHSPLGIFKKVMSASLGHFSGKDTDGVGGSDPVREVASRVSSNMFYNN